MGFYTVASCYRAGPHPPIVTGADLANFCRQVRAMDILRPDWHWVVNLKYGSRIDQDDKSTYCEDQVTSTLSVVTDYHWDVDHSDLTPPVALELLETPPRIPALKALGGCLLGKGVPSKIYRASLRFGLLREELTSTIQHELEGNCLYLSEVGLRIDVIEIANDDDMYTFQVGWMSVDVGGNGYPYPWTYEETLQRVREHPQLGALRDLCRTLWPASESPVPPELVQARQEMGKYWAEPLDAPYDWYWVIQGCA
jgi:hypothetical protein